MKALDVDSVDVCPWALREGIVLHYLQSTHQGSFDLPLRPLAGTAYQANGPGAQGLAQVAVIAAPVHAVPGAISGSP
jgi:exopolyphosphatase / guanosine-5'-triphosphate,3'-diphosphate pyrophosphatase